MSANTSHNTKRPTGATNPISRSEESRDRPPFLLDEPRITIALGSCAGDVGSLEVAIIAAPPQLRPLHRLWPRAPRRAIGPKCDTPARRRPARRAVPAPCADAERARR